MKLIQTGIAILFALMVALTGCDSSADRVVYDGPEYVMFADTLTYFPVSNSEDYLELNLGSTVACPYDRTYAVEVDDANSTAVEDYHFVIESNSVTIKAGERSAKFRIKGIYEHIDMLESLSVSFNLIADEAEQWDLYGTKTRVQIMKACPFDLNTFTGYCKLTSTYYSDYMTSTDMRLLETEAADDDLSVVLHDFYYDGYDLTISFDPTNPLEPFVSMDDQLLGSTAEAFGTVYGNGELMIGQPSAYISYYNVCQQFVVLYVTVYVENVGTVGTYVNVLEWISDQEAEQLKKEGY
ncbi:DUF4984 domain-containing protein [Mangrovibacterium marinum]|uniref:Uncharacterized protein DUF4843 n=1 Tax=Mangrovibacterium marinum TaxID=1639118 RepID=A0A2T5C642_9BACT|nr:DUF4984 domain-containing protein [Mangrovibacterium marinum]PTN10420.1 uncharacterized protein DUF4843 [Mangrovibacterium marinum]